jgi:hypothetical protein
LRQNVDFSGSLERKLSFTFFPPLPRLLNKTCQATSVFQFTGDSWDFKTTMKKLKLKLLLFLHFSQFVLLGLFYVVVCVKLLNTLHNFWN